MGFKLRKPKYEVVLWSIHITVTVLAIIDRFTTNIWPRQSFTVGAGSAGNDRMNGFKEGRWSVVTYDFLARLSGRYAIVTFNFMLISRMKILEQWLASSWIAKHVLDCSNISKSNIQAHKWNGIALCILTLLHVWSILLPCVTHSYSVQVIPGSFEWPLSERAPPGFKDSNAETQTMSLQIDDIWRLVEMTLLLGVVTPLSIRWMSRCWHIGIHVHRFVSVIYFVDIVRRHSHPHSWVLNTPIFVLWILDKLLCLVWRQVKSPNVIKSSLSDDYILLCWTVDQTPMLNEAKAVGANFLMKMKSSWLESPHPFTTFKNRDGNCSFLLHQDKTYTHGAVIRTFHHDRKPRIGGEARSHTERMDEHSSIWGPFQGNVTNLIPKAFPSHNGQDGFGSSRERNIVLAGSGSAINFILDLLSHLSCPSQEDAFDLESDNMKQIILLYSTRDVSLFRWVVDALANLLTTIDKKYNTIDRPKIRASLGCTAKSKKKASLLLDRTFELGDDLDSTGMEGSVSSEEKDLEVNTKQKYSSGVMELCYKRLDYKREIPAHSYVFGQGSEAFKSVVAAGCRGKEGVRLYLDQ